MEAAELFRQTGSGGAAVASPHRRLEPAGFIRLPGLRPGLPVPGRGARASILEAAPRARLVYSMKSTPSIQPTSVPERGTFSPAPPPDDSNEISSRVGDD